MMRKFYGAAYTDVGTVKTVNQDSLMIRIADIGMHKTAFAVVCDGMGGLQQGELASATVVYNALYENEEIRKNWKIYGPTYKQLEDFNYFNICQSGIKNIVFVLDYEYLKMLVI